MSISTSISPGFPNNFNTPIYSSPQVNISGGDSPIKQYMRQHNNFYLSQQQNTIQNGNSNMSTSEQLKNLKQFQRQLEEDRPLKNQHMTTHKISTPKYQTKQRTIYSPSIVEKQSEIYKEKNDSAYQHRAQSTSTYGNKVMDKIKSFILDEREMKSPKSPTPKKAQLSFNVSSSIQKLHRSYQQTQEIRRQHYIKNFLGQEIKQIKPFKVENPISLYLIEKKNEQEGGHKPLYERAIQIARQKSLSRLEKQLEKQQYKQLQQQEEIQKYQQLRKQKYSDSSTKEKQDKFYHDLYMKEKMKNHAKQHEKIKHLKEITKQKPYVSKVSKDLFNKIIEKNDLSKDFVKRNEEYKLEREKQKLKFIQKHDAEYCPFAPKISQSSRQIAKKYYQRKKQEQEQFRKKFNEEKQLNKKLHHLSQKANRSKSPSQQKPISNNRSTSAPKISKQLKRNDNQEKLIQKTESKQKQIPIYNRYTPDKKRTNSCFNIGCRK